MSELSISEIIATALNHCAPVHMISGLPPYLTVWCEPCKAPATASLQAPAIDGSDFPRWCKELSAPRSYAADLQSRGSAAWACTHEKVPCSCFLAKTTQGLFLTVREQAEYGRQVGPGWVMLLRSNSNEVEARRRFLQFLAAHWRGVVLSMGEDVSIPLPADNKGGVVLGRRIPEDVPTVAAAIEDAERMFISAVIVPALQGDNTIRATSRSIERGTLVVVPEDEFQKVRGMSHAAGLTDRILCVLEEQIDGAAGSNVSYVVQEAPKESARALCYACQIERSRDSGHGWWVGQNSGAECSSQAAVLSRLRSICKALRLQRQGATFQLVERTMSSHSMH